MFRQNKQAFTLIELLVAVLIMGILAAVALPQYQKAVEKSKISTAHVLSDALRTSLELHVLENGTDPYNLFAQDPEGGIINIPGCTIVQIEENEDRYCANKDFLYESYCSRGYCYVNAFRYKKTDYSDIRGHYALSWTLFQNKWNYTCYWHTEFGKNMCDSLPEVHVMRTF